LDQWIVSVEKYGRITGEKCYIHTERTDIGILASAVSSVGGTSLQEFQWTKAKKNRTQGNGRADLWIYLEAGRSKSEFVEVKRKWLSLNSNDSIVRIADILATARTDARRTQNRDKDTRCVGLSFVPTYIQKSKIAEVPDKIQDLVAAIHSGREQIGYDAFAWCFPAADQKFADERYIVPGIILLASLI
jgi:hypothetical protein